MRIFFARIDGEMRDWLGPSEAPKHYSRVELFDLPADLLPLGDLRAPVEIAPWCIYELNCLRSSRLSNVLNKILHQPALIRRGEIALHQVPRRRFGEIAISSRIFCRAIFTSCSAKNWASSLIFSCQRPQLH